MKELHIFTQTSKRLLYKETFFSTTVNLHGELRFQ